MIAQNFESRRNNMIETLFITVLCFFNMNFSDLGTLVLEA